MQIPVYVFCIFVVGRGSVLGIVTRLWVGRSGVRMSEGAEIFLFSETSRPAAGPTQLPIQWASGFFPGVIAVGS